MSAAPTEVSIPRGVQLGARLRWRIARNRLRKGGVLLFVVVLVVAGLAALGGLLGLAAGRALDEEDRRVLYTVSFTLLVLGWIFLPITAGGADETVDPTRLALLPLRRTALLAVLFGAAASGPATVAALVALVGVPIGTAPAGPGAVVTVLAVPVTFCLGLGVARLAGALLVRAQRSRRGRDLAVFVSAIAGVTVWVAIQAIGPLLSSENGSSGSIGNRVVDVLAWLPPGWAASAVVAASAGRLGEGVLWLGAATTAAAAALYLWAVVTERLLANPERTVASTASSDGAPLGRARTRLGAAMAKELRYALRSPARRVQLLLGGVMGIGFSAIQALPSDSGDRPEVVFFGLWGSLFTLAGSFNVIGFDSASLWLEVVSGGPDRERLAARTAAWLPQLFLPGLLAVLVIATWTGQWRLVPLAVLLVASFALVGLGAAAVVSTLAPVPANDGDNPFAFRQGMGGKGCVTGIFAFAGVASLGVLAAPIVVPAILGRNHLWGHLVALAGIPWGLLWWRTGVNFGARRLEGRGPELIAELSARAVT